MLNAKIIQQGGVLSASTYVKNILWQVSGNSVAQAIGIIFMPIISRIYTPENFSVLNLYSQVVAALTIFVTLRLEYFVVMPKRHEDAHSILRLLVRYGLMLTGFFTVMLYFFAERVSGLLGNSALEEWLIYAPISAWLLSISLGLQQSIQRYQVFKGTGAAEVMGKSGYVVAATAGSTMLPNAAGLVLASTFGTIVKSVLLTVLLMKKGLKGHSSEGWAIAFDINKLAGAMIISGVLGIVTGLAPLVYISHAYGQNMLGQFGLVVSTLYLPSSLLGLAIGQVYYQRVAQMMTERKEISAVWRQTAVRLILMSGPLYFSIALLSGWAYPFIFGEEWAMAGKIASIMAVSAGLAFASTPLDRTSLVVGISWYLPAWHLLRAVTVILVILISNIYEFEYHQFFILLMVQMSSMYLMDWLAGYFFSKKSRFKF